MRLSVVSGGYIIMYIYVNTVFVCQAELPTEEITSQHSSSPIMARENVYRIVVIS